MRIGREFTNRALRERPVCAIQCALQISSFMKLVKRTRENALRFPDFHGIVRVLRVTRPPERSTI